MRPPGGNGLASYTSKLTGGRDGRLGDSLLGPIACEEVSRQRMQPGAEEEGDLGSGSADSKAPRSVWAWLLQEGLGEWNVGTGARGESQDW